MKDSSSFDRREFLRRGAIAGAGLSLMPLPAAAGDVPRVRRRAVLGRTGLEVSDISFGANSLSDEGLVRHAIDRGINYFDTAAGYRFGGSEETLGRALQGVRKDVLITTKSKVDAGHTRDDMMEALEASLRRLQTDYVDVFMNHAVNDVARVANPEWPEFTSRAKQQGKIRFCGLSGHGGELASCVAHALDHDLVDVMLLAHNFGQDPAFYQKFLSRLDWVAIQPELPALMDRARKQGVGVVAMKTLRGARLNDLRAYEEPGGTYAQAAFRWVLASGHVDALIVSMTHREQIDEYLGASGHTRVTGQDVAMLRRYEVRNGTEQCRYGCSACTCPEGVPVSEVLRTHMYARDYGDIELARRDYAALGDAASVCASCDHQACTGSCPFGIRIQEQTRSTHLLLAGTGAGGDRGA